METKTLFNTVILMNIRRSIITAMNSLGLLIGIDYDYTLSDVHKDRIWFRIELQRETLFSKAKLIKSAIRKKFDQSPEFEIECPFIKMNFQKEYDHREELNNQ